MGPDKIYASAGRRSVLDVASRTDIATSVHARLAELRVAIGCYGT